MHGTTSYFALTSDRLLLPLTMQVIMLPFFCRSTNRLCIFLMAHGQRSCHSSGWLQRSHPESCWPHIEPVASTVTAARSLLAKSNLLTDHPSFTVY